ncbi:MAG: type-4 uracil-DNA glycosylase [Candidatus Bathyarchaeia archaeon]
MTTSKQDRMGALAAEVRACQKCELGRLRRNPVPGEGNLDAAVMFIGEAPGYWEDVKGRPFVGAAGKLLDEMLSKIRLSRSQVYIANILKCRPPENRDPLPAEVRACTPFLDRQIEIIEPRFIVPLGRHSASYILSKAGLEVGGITKLRGRVYEVSLLGSRVFVIPMYHPAAALYNIKYRDRLEDDFRLLGLELERRRSLQFC